MWPAEYASRERASITTMSESPAPRSTDKSHESVWKRSLSSIITAVSPGSGAPYSRTAEISGAMIDSVFEDASDLRSSEPEAQPIRPARKSNRLCRRSPHYDHRPSQPAICSAMGHGRAADGSFLTQRWRELDSNLYGAFSVKSCFWFVGGSLFEAGKPFFVPSPNDQVRGARGRGQGTEMLAELSGLPLSRACVSQRLDA